MGSEAEAFHTRADMPRVAQEAEAIGRRHAGEGATGCTCVCVNVCGERVCVYVCGERECVYVCGERVCVFVFVVKDCLVCMC